MKYRPDFPGHLASIEAARQHCQVFFPWYNDEHRHVGLACTPPPTSTTAPPPRSVSNAASCSPPPTTPTPERFVRQPSKPPALPTGSWINPPDQKEAITQ
jgi:putative transposase